MDFGVACYKGVVCGKHLVGGSWPLDLTESSVSMDWKLGWQS